MKQLFLFGLLMTMMLASCSSDNDNDGDTTNPLIGFWQASGNNVTYYYEFTDRAVAHFWYDQGDYVKYEKLAYSITDNKVTLVASDGRTENSTFEVKNGKVTIYSGNTPLTLSKVDKPSWIDYKDINRNTSVTESVLGKWQFTDGYDIINFTKQPTYATLRLQGANYIEGSYYGSNIAAYDIRYWHNDNNDRYIKIAHTNQTRFVYIYVLEVTDASLKVIVGITENQYNENQTPTITNDTKITTFKKMGA